MFEGLLILLPRNYFEWQMSYCERFLINKIEGGRLIEASFQLVNSQSPQLSAKLYGLIGFQVKVNMDDWILIVWKCLVRRLCLLI